MNTIRNIFDIFFSPLVARLNYIINKLFNLYIKYSTTWLNINSFSSKTDLLSFKYEKKQLQIESRIKLNRIRPFVAKNMIYLENSYKKPEMQSLQQITYSL